MPTTTRPTLFIVKENVVIYPIVRRVYFSDCEEKPAHQDLVISHRWNLPNYHNHSRVIGLGPLGFKQTSETFLEIFCN